MLYVKGCECEQQPTEQRPRDSFRARRREQRKSPDHAGCQFCRDMVRGNGRTAYAAFARLQNEADHGDQLPGVQPVSAIVARRAPRDDRTPLRPPDDQRREKAPDDQAHKDTGCRQEKSGQRALP